MIRALLLFIALVMASPAGAHSLRVFAKVTDGQVSGYGFFVGGGRPQGVAWRAEMGGEPFASGRTGAEGGFAFAAPAPVLADVVVTLDTAEGHIAQATLPPARFGAAPLPPSPALQTLAPQTAPAATDPPLPADLVEAAVARQVAPLIERIEQMDARLRLADVMSGVFLIIGLAGIALWARSRK